ncbi:GspH/FimT family pseudopilin [Marinobacter sp.]|uniref:GspH/FimT family pseudopilin n=1 Tax=Marinobacter sp. TaxID=50741 RepID=UPI00356567C3
MYLTTNNKGFTLVELMIVIALIAVIAGFAIPQFGRIIDNNRVVSTTNSIVGLLNYSRSEAVRRGVRVTVSSASDTLVTTLASNGDVIRQMEEADGGLNITAGAVTFRANGLTTSNADVAFNVCAGSADGRTVTVTPGGRVVTTDFTCP